MTTGIAVWLALVLGAWIVTLVARVFLRQRIAAWRRRRAERREWESMPFQRGGRR